MEDAALPGVSFTLFELIDAMSLLSLAASAIPILAWIFRAHKNLHEAGLSDLAFTPSWAAGWFFMPIFCLWQPFLAVQALWQRSHGAVPDAAGSDDWPVIL